MFLREDGLWLFSGGKVSKVSRAGFDAISSPQSITQAGELLYLSGSEKAYIAIDRGDGWAWHESSHYLPYASSTSGVPYGASAREVSQLFDGVEGEGRFTTKKWGSPDMSQMVKLELDIEGDTIPEVVINGDVMTGTIWHPDETAYSYPGRRIVWTHLPRIMSNFIDVGVKVSGGCRVRGIRGSNER